MEMQFIEKLGSRTTEETKEIFARSNNEQHKKEKNVNGEVDRNGMPKQSESEERPPHQAQEFVPKNEELQENAMSTPNWASSTVGVIEYAPVQEPSVQEQPIGIVEIPIHFPKFLVPPQEVNEFYEFESAEEVTSALIHASQCVVGNCNSVRQCARLKESFKHLRDCEERRSGCRRCWLFFRLLSFHGQDCEQDDCGVSFCLSLRLKMGEETLKAQRNGRKFRKVRVGRRIIKKGEYVQCPCCLLKKITLTE